jgi:hypothetical protein
LGWRIFDSSNTVWSSIFRQLWQGNPDQPPEGGTLNPWVFKRNSPGRVLGIKWARLFCFRVTLQDNFVNQPAPGRKDNDIKLISGLAYKFQCRFHNTGGFIIRN